jgi:DNA-binding NtrC family response regulator
MDKMMNYRWPGNVRELENVIERAVLLARGTNIEAASLPFAAERSMHAAVAAAPQSAPAPESPAAAEPTFERPAREAAAVESAPPPPVRTDEPAESSNGSGEHGFVVPSGMTLEEIERSVIYQTLKRTKGNKQAAANALGIYRPRLYSKIKKYNMTEFM